MAKDNVIFISTQNIQVVKGSCEKTDMIKIEDYKTYDLGEGAMINGVITDEQSVKDILETIKADGITVARLVIDSGQIIVKNMVVPFLKKKEILNVVRDELSSVEQNYEDLIYDYSILQERLEEQSGGEILCCAVERKFLSSYVDLFASVGIKLKSVDISVNALQKLTQELPDFEHKTYIVSMIDGNNVSSYLFEDNHYTFSNRTRLFSERGTEAFTLEMNSNISQLIQFNKSKRSSYTIECTYFCGLSDAEEPLVFDSIKQNLNIGAQPFPSSKVVFVTDSSKGFNFQLHDYVYPVGSLIRK